MSHKPRIRYQRMQLVVELAKIIQRNTTDQSIKELASTIQLVLAAPSELLSQARLDQLEQLIHENSGNCCFKQRGYNWHFEGGEWGIAACDVCRTFDTWLEALHVAMRDAEFRALKPK